MYFVNFNYFNGGLEVVDQNWINEFRSPVIIIRDNGLEFLANFKK